MDAREIFPYPAFDRFIVQQVKKKAENPKLVKFAAARLGCVQLARQLARM